MQISHLSSIGSPAPFAQHSALIGSYCKRAYALQPRKASDPCNIVGPDRRKLRTKEAGHVQKQQSCARKVVRLEFLL